MIFRIFILCLLPYFIKAQFIINSPRARMVVQRDAANRARLIIAGTAPNSASTIEARLIPMVVGQGTPSSWAIVATVNGDKTFRGELAALGGWYRVEIRAKAATEIIADTAVSRVGVGEVFIIAGQSNAQGGVETNVPAAIDDRVSCVDLFQRDRIDDQAFPFMFSHVSAGASVGPSNSPYFWGILGDSLTRRLNVPVLFLGAAQGGSNSTEWKISAAETPITPPYQRISSTLLFYINRLGLRGILWHQGESDGGVAEQTYVNNLTAIISKSRQQLNHSRLAWLVSRASYISGTTNSQVISAQNRLSREVPDVYAGPATDALIGPDNRVDDIHFGGQGLSRVANLWNQSLSDLFFNQSVPFIPTADSVPTDVGWKPVTTGTPFSSLQRVGYRYESASHNFFFLVGATTPVEGRLERLDSGDFTDTSWSTLTPTVTSGYNNTGFSDYTYLRFYPPQSAGVGGVAPGRYRLSVRKVNDTGPGYQLETVLHDLRNTLFIGNEPTPPVIQQATGPDLTINMDLPQANFAAEGSVDNFVVNVFEVAGFPTSSGSAKVTITAPVGYVLSFAPAQSTINVSGGSTVAVNNAQWTVTSSFTDRQLTMTMNSGAFISGGGRSSLGLSITRTTANSGSAANITANIEDDMTKSYDGNLSNNIYARIISGL